VSEIEKELVRRTARSIPFLKHLGIRLVRLGHGRSEIKLNVTRSLTQSKGIAHGGVAASLIDSAIGFALHTMIKPGEMTTTVEMKVNYLAPVPPGVLRASGKIIHRGKRIAVGEGEVRNREGILVAKGLATYIILEDN
jgi:acyl-CoA thioesterase